jgi:hypothetical protein
MIAIKSKLPLTEWTSVTAFILSSDEVTFNTSGGLVLADGKLPRKGFIRQQVITLADFLNSRFDRVYDPEAMRLKQAM